MAQPLMPHATASWLVDNTALSFEQIAEFCGLHILEIQAIADDTAATKLTGRDPVRAHELTQEEIEKGQNDPSHSLVMLKGPDQVRRTKGPRYTPVSKRQDKPDGIAWIIRNHPEISDAQISKLLGTTKSTIQSVRDRTHWNSANITPQDPVALGLCSQTDLDNLVRKAAAKRAKLMPTAADTSPTLKPAVETVVTARIEEPREEREKPIDLDKVFANLGGSSKPQQSWEDDEDEDEFGRKKKRR